MRAFYANAAAVEEPGITSKDPSSYISTRARVAVYDSPAAAPYVEDIDHTTPREFIEQLSARVYELARNAGGSMPYTVVREVAENLIHARFREPVISVLDGGCTIRFSDQGPGFADSAQALQPGFTTATSEMKDVIRGVGSGLPIVREFLSHNGGHLTIEDNLNRGAVVTIRSASPATAPRESHGAVTPKGRESGSGDSQVALFSAGNAVGRGLRLSTRQKQVLALVLEVGSVGPSVVSRELGVGLSTAYRDLATLEDFGLITADGGKRVLTDEGSAFLGAMIATNE